MSAGRKRGSNERKGPGVGIDPEAPTRSSVFAAGSSLASPPVPYQTDARTLAVPVASDDDGPDAEDPFRARETDTDLRSFSSSEAYGDDGGDNVHDTRIDIARPRGTERIAISLDEGEVIEVSLSDMEAMPAVADDDPEEETDTDARVLRARARLVDDDPPPLPGPKTVRQVLVPQPDDVDEEPPVGRARVVERKSYNPSALFDEDTGAVGDDDSLELPVVERAKTTSVPSLATTPSGSNERVSTRVARSEGADDDDEFETVLPDGEEDAPPPLINKWKVIPTAIRHLDAYRPPLAPSGGFEKTKALHTVLWTPEQEAAARAGKDTDAKRRFWVSSEASQAADRDDAPESTESPVPQDSKLAAAAYIHDAIAYLRTLSHLGAHLSDDVRRDFQARVLGCNEKLRRALTVLHSATDDDES